MQAHYHKLPHQFDQSISIRHDRRPYFSDHWHYHSKLELVFIIKGEGTRFIGDNISGFKDGDLVLLGAYLPHVWKSSDNYLDNFNDDNVEAIVIHFQDDLGATGLMDLPEMNTIKKMLQQAHLGISYQLTDQHEIYDRLIKMVDQTPFERIISLLYLLLELANLEHWQLISKTPFASHYMNHQSKRVDSIYDYILNNFDKDIKLNDLASIANMTPASLCRFFKQKTKKSLSEFTNEVRIGFACKLIIEDQLSISDICFRCGYNSLSYFNRQFKKVTGVAPSTYLKVKNSFR